MNRFRQAFLLVSFFFLTCCGAEESSDLRRLSLNKNQFLIVFPANPTTGYVWSIDYYDQRRIHLLKSQYMTPDKTKGMGAAGKMIYEFEVLDVPVYPFSSVIRFKYARPWDKNNSIRKTAIITLKKAQQKPLVKIQ